MYTYSKSVFYVFATFCVANARMSCPYQIPTPSVTVYKPRGLEISIPDAVDVNLVIFYVSINRDVTEGDLPYREYVSSKTNDRWTMNKEDMEVNVGDTVHFRIFVRRRRRGYLHIGTPYLITDRVKRPSKDDDNYPLPSCQSNLSTTTTSTTIPPSTSNIPPSVPSIDCTLSLHTALRALSDAQRELEALKADQQILRELASKGSFILYLSGLVTETGESKAVVEFVLFEKLDLRLSVQNVVKSGSTIKFEVSSLEQKLDILKRAKKHLRNSPDILISA